MKKKLIVIGACIVVIYSIFVLNITNVHERTKRIQLELNKNDVQSINITALPAWFDTFNITDEVQISNVVDYLTSLDLVKTKINRLEGGGFLIKVFLKDGTVRELNHSGNIYLIEENGIRGQMTYKEAAKFQRIVASILEENSIKSGESSITGTIVSIKAETSGRDLSCIIRDKDNINHNINVEAARIIDAADDGWLILHDKDLVRVFYNKGAQKDKNIIYASSVYIKAQNSNKLQLQIKDQEGDIK
jgi:hypothetical protein